MAGLTDLEADLIFANVKANGLQAEIDRMEAINKALAKNNALNASKVVEVMEERDKAISRAEKAEAERDELQKAFALACRFIFDKFTCPATDADANFLECYGELDDCGNVERWECWQRHFLEKVQAEQVCHVCGCTEDNACPGGCWWVEKDLCSNCAGSRQLKKS